MSKERTHRYEIGKQRSDGKFNIWTLAKVHPHYPAEWVIAHVADSMKGALLWCRTQARRAAA